MSVQGRRIPDEWLLRDLWRVTQRLGHPPNTTDYIEHGRYSPTPYGRWGSWADALAHCGLDPDPDARDREPVRTATDEGEDGRRDPKHGLAKRLADADPDDVGGRGRIE